MSRALRAAALAAAALSLAACSGGEDEDRAGDSVPATVTGSSTPGAAPQITEPELRDLLEQRLQVQWDGSAQAAVAEQLDDAPAASRRLTTVSGRELDVLLYASPRAARQAWPELRRTEVLQGRGAATRAANAVLVLPAPPDEVPEYQRAWKLFRALGDACASPGPGDDAQLRRTCFDPGEAPDGPQGTDPGEPAPEGTTVSLAGVQYRVTLARRLNPAISPDDTLVGRRTAGPGTTLFGVFLRACNEAEGSARATDELRLVSAGGRTAQPAGLPRSNEFAYRAERLAQGDCVPAAGSPPDLLDDGALVLFEVPEELLEDRPVTLELRADGERRRLELDL